MNRTAAASSANDVSFRFIAIEFTVTADSSKYVGKIKREAGQGG